MNFAVNVRASCLESTFSQNTGPLSERSCSLKSSPFSAIGDGLVDGGWRSFGLQEASTSKVI